MIFIFILQKEIFKNISFSFFSQKKKKYEVLASFFLDNFYKNLHDYYFFLQNEIFKNISFSFFSQKKKKYEVLASFFLDDFYKNTHDYYFFFTKKRKSKYTQ